MINQFNSNSNEPPSLELLNKMLVQKLNKVEIDSKQLQLESEFFKEFIQTYYT